MFANRHWEERDPNEATGSGPCFVFYFHADGSRYEKPRRARVGVNGSPHGAKDRWHHLPFVDQDRFIKFAKSDVWICGERGSFRWDV